jgi:hypothetical protein
MEGHFKEFKRCKDHWHILDEDIYNFDETGYMIGVVSGSLVIVPLDCETVYVDDPANRELVTSTECISASGHHVPPMIIFKGAYHLRKYFKNDIDGRVLFNRYTKSRTLGRYRMLIFDGFGSHVTQNFINYCWEHRIRPYQLIPHSTHLTQPLDVGAFQKAKHEFKKLVREEVFHGATEITKADFFSIFNKFSSKTFTADLCRAAFRKAGLVPFDPSIVLSQMKEYGGIQDKRKEESIDDEELAFATPPPPPWTEF